MANKNSGNNPWEQSDFNEQEILNNAKGADVQSLMQKLSPEQRSKVQSILNDPVKTSQILSNPKIQQLIRKFKGNG